MVVNYRDITERKALEEQLRHQAFHDALTGLANRALFLDRLGHALARAGRGGPADRGPLPRPRRLQGGQRQPRPRRRRRLLVDVARAAALARPAPATRSPGSAATSSRSCSRRPSRTRRTQAARRILESLREPFDARRARGRGPRQHRHRDPGGRRRRRRRAAAPRRRRDVRGQGARQATATSRYEPQMHDATVDRHGAQGRPAQARSSAASSTSPTSRSSTSSPARSPASEALVRWRPPEPRRCPADDFIPLAEENGLISPSADGCSRRRAARPGRGRWQHGPAGLTISVNLSGRQLAGPDLVDDVGRVAAGVRPRPAQR